MKKKQTRLLVIGSTLGSYGGMEAFMIAMAKAASGWPNFEVRLCFKIIKDGVFSKELINQATMEVERVDFVKRASLQLFRTIIWADVLHVQNTPPDIIFTARLLLKKICLTVHNYKRNNFSIHNFLWGISNKLADHRWYNSHFVWNTWEPNKKLKNSKAFPTVSNLPRSWKDPIERKGFLFLGRWVENKGIEELIQAYALNDFETKKFPLTILGDGDLRPTVRKLINDLKQYDIILPGFVSAEEKEDYLASAKWVLAPAKTKEDLGLTPIEARSVGVPSIITRDGGLPEAGGKAALIAEPGNVEDLARCLKIAYEMEEEEYANRCHVAKKSLDDFLVPLKFYKDMFKNS